MIIVYRCRTRDDTDRAMSHHIELVYKSEAELVMMLEVSYGMLGMAMISLVEADNMVQDWRERAWTYTEEKSEV